MCAFRQDEDLELIFSRFGTIKSCQVIRDFKTGDSLNYAFIEFEVCPAHCPFTSVASMCHPFRG